VPQFLWQERSGLAGGWLRADRTPNPCFSIGSAFPRLCLDGSRSLCPPGTKSVSRAKTSDDTADVRDPTHSPVEASRIPACVARSRMDLAPRWAARISSAVSILFTSMQTRADSAGTTAGPCSKRIGGTIRLSKIMISCWEDLKSKPVRDSYGSLFQKHLLWYAAGSKPPRLWTQSVTS
jgi:hypothetical protein